VRRLAFAGIGELGSLEDLERATGESGGFRVE
jgi:hypothetical protein